MKRKYRDYGAICCMLINCLLAACGMHDDVSDCSVVDDATGGKSAAYVKLRLLIPDGEEGTRANPTGGEDGDGREEGQSYENAISSALVFFYRDAQAINASASTAIEEYAYFSSLTRTAEGVYETEEHEMPLQIDTPYNVLVVANPGSYDWARQATTLGQVRDHLYTAAWRQTDGAYADFVMSSEDGTETIAVAQENFDKANPARVSVTVERLAVRVDYQAENSYTCEDASYPGATVEIQGATLLNQLTAGTYLIKRVTTGSDINGTVAYLADEEPVAGGVATNYVIDPWTLDKTLDNADLQQTPFTLNGTNVNAMALYDATTYFKQPLEGKDNPEEWSALCVEGVDMTGASAGWKRAGYTMENTTSAANTSRSYNTGIVFKAQFHPQGVQGYTDGNTFFTYDATIYPSLTALVSSYYEVADFAQYVATAPDVNTLATVLGAKGDPVGYVAYLQRGISDGHTGTDWYQWTTYMRDILGCVETSGVPAINQGGVETRAALYAASGSHIRTYYNGECYYIWWLRHSNDGDDQVNGLMEYATVRNNIYKVKVGSIYSLGSDIPEDENLRVHVYVKHWTGLAEEVLPM